MNKSRLLAAAFCVVLAYCVPASASTVSYSDIYIFGDSNNFANNGSMWAEHLAPQVGTAFDPGKRFAFGGAVSGNVQAQIADYQSSFPVTDPLALYVIWVGGNDLSATLPSGSGSNQVAADAANNIVTAVNSLISLGAENILVPNLPFLERYPVPNAETVSAAGLMFNNALAADLPPSAVIGDLFTLVDEIVADPASFGLSNVTDGCTLVLTQFECDNPTIPYLFYDSVHFTNLGQSAIADRYFETLSLHSVPVPAAVWLFGSGLVGLIGVARKRKAT